MATALNTLLTSEALENWTEPFDLADGPETDGVDLSDQSAPRERSTHRPRAARQNVALSTAKMTRRDRVVLEHLPLVKAIAVRGSRKSPRSR